MRMYVESDGYGYAPLMCRPERLSKHKKQHVVRPTSILTLFPNAVRKHLGALVQRLLGSMLENKVLRISSRFSCWVRSLNRRYIHR